MSFYLEGVILEAFDACCTFRCALSGNEILKLSRAEIRGLRNTKDVYLHVRRAMRLSYMESLDFYFGDCRVKKDWNLYEKVLPSDGDMDGYLDGAVLEVVRY